MIEYIEGDIFQSPAQVIVNAVNTVGVMGKGIALSFKKRYPDMFKVYRDACEKRQLSIGKLMLCYGPDYWVLMFPTKEHWRNPSKIEYIEAGLQKFVNTYAQKNITSIAFPRLGCGNGELNWDEVRDVMERYLKPLPIDVYIYLGGRTEEPPEHKKQEEVMDWLRGHAKDMSFVGLKEDIEYNSCMCPISFRHGGADWSAKWSDGIMFAGGSRVHLSEDDVRQYWDNIRTNGVVRTNSSDQGYSLLLAFLAHMGYLNGVRIQDKEGESLLMRDGYQLMEGAGRLFTARSAAK